jgi:hypothetical protein
MVVVGEYWGFLWFFGVDKIILTGVLVVWEGKEKAPTGKKHQKTFLCKQFIQN